MMKVYYTKVNNTIGNWRNIVVKGAEYNEGHSYKDLFQGRNYDNFLVELEDKQFSLDDEEVYDTNTDEINDQYLGIKVVSSRYDSTQEGTVIRRKHYSDGTLFRTKNINPILNTRVYEVDFPNESIYDLTTNIIVGNVFDSISEDGDHHTYLDYIVEIRSTEDTIQQIMDISSLFLIIKER